MAILKVSDTMAGANGDDLNARAPETDVVGNGWIIAAANDVEVDGSGGARFAAVLRSARIDVGVTDQSAVFNWNSGGADNRMSAYLRSDDVADTGTAYYFNFKPGDGTGAISIAKTVGGSPTTVATKASMGLSTSANYEVEVSAIDDGAGGVDLEFKVNSVVELTYKDTTSIITTGNFVKLRHGAWANGQGRIFDINAYEATEASVGATITGTLNDATQSEIVTGGTTSIITLSADTFIAAGDGAIGTTAQTQSIIDGVVSAQSEIFGFNNEVTGTLVRTDDVTATITWNAAPNVVITQAEFLTTTIPAAVLTTSAIDVVSSDIQRIRDLHSTADVYYFLDNKTGADGNATAGNNANDGLSDATAFQTYDHLLTLYNSAAAGTRFRLGRACGFSQSAALAVNNQNAVVTITGITRTGTVATATTSKPHNMLPGASTTVRGCSGATTGFNGYYFVTAIPTTTSFQYTVVTTPTTPATTDEKIRFDGGMVVIEEYTSTEFTPVVDADPYIAYNTADYQHNFNNASASEGYHVKDVHYEYIGSQAGDPAVVPFHFSSTSKEGNIFDGVTLNGYRHGWRPSSQIGSILRNSKLINNFAIGMYGGGSYNLIEYNEFTNNGHNTADGGGDTSLHNIYASEMDNSIIRGNTLYQSAMNAGEAQGVSLVAHGTQDGNIIENNYIYEDIGACAQSAWGIGIDTGYPSAEEFSNFIIRRNKIVNCGNQSIHVSAFTDGIIENNLLIHYQTYSAMGINCDAPNQGTGNAPNSNIKVRNNSFSGNYNTVIAAIEGTGFEFVSNAAHVTYTTTATMFNLPLSTTDTTNYSVVDNNLFYAPNASSVDYEQTIGGNLAAWQSASVFSDNDQYADPLYASLSDLQPLEGSPLLNNGHLTLSAIEDYLEAVRDGTPDIGAYEGITTPPPATTGSPLYGKNGIVNASVIYSFPSSGSIVYTPF